MKLEAIVQVCRIINVAGNEVGDYLVHTSPLASWTRDFREHPEMLPQG
jgi:hypothetical protein